MDVRRVDVLSIFDVTIDAKCGVRAVEARLRPFLRSNSSMAILLNASYDWMFYEAQHEGFQLYDVSHIKRAKNTVGVVIRLDCHARLGTCII